MDVYTYSEARQNLSNVLKKAESDGKVSYTQKRRQDLCPGAGASHRVTAGCSFNQGRHLYTGNRHTCQAREG